MSKTLTFQEEIDAAVDLYAETIGCAGARKSRRACYNLAAYKGTPAELVDLLQRFTVVIQGHWNSERPVVKSNWQWRTDNRDFSDKNAEVWLERTIITKAESPDWTYQIPTASGLLKHSGSKRRSIDLVHRLSPSTFEFIELKNDSNTPFSAAFELLLYAALYLFTRSREERHLPHRHDVGYDLLSASEIHLKVLAPVRYYRGCQLTPFARAVNSAVKIFGKDSGLGVAMTFSFEQWPEWFPAWPQMKQELTKNLRSALEDRQPAR